MEQLTHTKTRTILSVMCGLLGLLSSCDNSVLETQKALQTTSTAVPSPPASSSTPSMSTSEKDVDPSSAWDDGPMGAWTVANNLADFHATWTEYCAQSAIGPVGPDTLVPYADALARNGESWGLSTTVPELILLDTEGHAYRYPDGRHGTVPAQENRFPLNRLALNKLDWSILESGQQIHILNGGNTLRFLGALRATGHCRSCHEEPESTLLGAYCYAFHEIADD